MNVARAQAASWSSERLAQRGYERISAGRPAAMASGDAAGERRVIAREILARDLNSVAALLHEGFPRKSASQFLDALNQLGLRPAISNLPLYGHLLEVNGNPVGVLLTISARIEDGDQPYTRCNVACWYVKPQFRMYASLLVLRTNRRLDVTHLNISPAENTWRTIASQGFQPLCAGTFAGVPALSGAPKSTSVLEISSFPHLHGGVTEAEARLLRDHAAFGCHSVICRRGSEGFPFVFRRRQFRRIPMAAAQLIYCRNLSSVSEFAGSIGGYLMRRGMPWMIAGANRKLEGIKGAFFEEKMPIYWKGLHTPREGDLAYTEAAIFGF